jgi:hypothetical protein
VANEIAQNNLPHPQKNVRVAKTKLQIELPKEICHIHSFLIPILSSYFLQNNLDEKQKRPAQNGPAFR